MNAPACPLFAALFEPDDIVEVRCLGPGGKTQSKWFTAADLTAKGAAKLLEGASVYFGANPRKSFGEKDKAGVALARCLFVDLDGVDLDAANHRWLDAGLPTPTAVVFSGGGVHLWWRLDEPIADLADWTARQKRLIRLTGADKAIHDPPRIMRYPGTLNVKRNVPSELIDCKPSRTYPVDEFPPEEGSAMPLPTGPTKDGWEGLSRQTLLFMSAGAPAGERNARLFAAACDFAGCGLPIAEAMARLLRPVVGPDFPESEGRAAIESAYRQPRNPAKPPALTNERLADMGLGVQSGVAGDTENAPMPSTVRTKSDTQTPINELIGLPRIANVVDEKYENDEGEKKTRTYCRGVREIGSDVYRVTGNWPRVVGGQMFVEQERGGRYVARILKTHDELFAWLHERCMVRWASPRNGGIDKATGQMRSAVTRPELVQHMRETCPIRYMAVSDIPHHPAIETVHYMPCELPPATGDRLKEFIDHLNPETENDRRLMLAALLTTLWGGPPGSRPMFCFTAATKQGSGKTATAYAIADIVGGAFGMDPRAKWAENAKAMMSSDKWAARVILWDNVKGRFGGESIEAAVTSPTINGWQAYVGTITRLNDVTHFVTLNDPELSPDLALRSVEIRIGRPKHGTQFISWARRFVAEHRLQIISDALAILKTEPCSEVRVDDRFGDWQHAVLARIPNGDELSEWIVDRRGSLDADAKLGDDLTEAMQTVLIKQNRMSGEVTSDDLYAAALASGVWKDDPARGIADNRRRAVRMVSGILGGHGLKLKTGESGTANRRKVHDDAGTRWVNLYDWSPVLADDDSIPV